MQTQETKTCSLTAGGTNKRIAWSLRGKVLLTLLVGALCVEGAMAVQGYVFDANPCVINDGNFDSREGGCKDLRTGRVWSRNIASPQRIPSAWTQGGAANYCSSLVEGGYDDWRLPTRDELKMVAANGAGTHLDVFTVQLTPGGNISSYWDLEKWSSTTYKKGKYTYAYAVKLASGVEYSYTLNSAIDAVCVRQPN